MLYNIFAFSVMAFQSRFRPCPWSAVYDARHIREKGYNCPYKHCEYRWPSVMRHSSTLLSDSIPKFINTCYELNVQAVPGLRLNSLLYKIKLGQFRIKDCKLVILHCGTNDFLSKSNDEIVCLLQRTVSAVRRLNPLCIIAVSSIIQRPCDDNDRSQRLCELNRSILKMCRNEKCEFLKTYRAFLGCEKSCFAIDGLHLNRQGVQKLKSFFEHTVRRLKGRY